MSRLVGLALGVNIFFSGLCPGCREKLSEHLSSRRYPRPGVGIPVVLGLCYPGGLDAAPGLQKISWVQMSEAMTETEYRKRFSHTPPPMERCPCCRGPLNHHGHYMRGLGTGNVIEPLPIYRGVCKNPCCPVVTVTHYPVFVLPNKVASAEVVESMIRERVEKGFTWAKLGDKCGYGLETIRRWYASVSSRAAEIMNVLLFQEQKYQPAAAAGVPPVSSETLLMDMFGVADRVAGLLTDAGLWRWEIPRLSLARQPCRGGVGPVPVWVR
ncbi:MAG: hypothetical protein QXI12_06445 [Candidatus Methanomethyliaceae archaeon]